MKAEAAKSDAFEEIECGLEKLWDQTTIVRDEYVVLWASSLKWYDVNPDVQFVMRFLAGVEHEYLRIGEEFGDHDYENTFEENYYDSFFYPSATISFTF